MGGLPEDLLVGCLIVVLLVIALGVVGQYRSSGASEYTSKPKDPILDKCLERDAAVRQLEEDLEKRADDLGLVGEEREEFINYWSSQGADAIGRGLI
jgi:hypothetical protein